MEAAAVPLGAPSAHEEYEPRYLELPRRGRNRARRNLIAGVIILILCVPLFGWVLYLGGPATAMILVSCLATATALYVIARARIFHQPNGGFLAMALVCLVGVFIAFTQQIWLAAARPASSPQLSSSGQNESAPAATPSPIPSLVESFSIPTPDPARGPRVKILKKAQVSIDGKNYALLVGDTFPLVEATPDDAIFLAGAREIKLSKDYLEVLNPKRTDDTAEANSDGRAAAAPPANEPDPAAIRAAKVELQKRYPGVFVPNSPENRLYVAKYNELKAASPYFFERPDWPLQLGELLARSAGWKRAAPHVVEDDQPEDAKQQPVRKAQAVTDDEPADKDAPVNKTAPSDRPTDANDLPEDKGPAPTQPAPPSPVENFPPRQEPAH